MNGPYTYLIMQNTWREGDGRLYSDYGKRDTVQHSAGLTYYSAPAYYDSFPFYV
jgi:hypothetical protein